jgi:hypothetical protein
MRTSWWAYIFVVVLTCLNQHFNQPWLPTESVGPSEQSERQPLDQKPELPLTYKDDGRLTEGRGLTGANVQIIGIDTTSLAIQDQHSLQLSPRKQGDALTIYDQTITFIRWKS